jgi:6-pyruvoyltetrahydropterin/6-carboxytetrahydropterin synthase
MPLVSLTRRAQFAASHRLHCPSLSDAENRRIFDKCNNPNGHGHNYVVEVTVRGEADPVTGMVMNLNDLKAAMEKAILREMDHKHLNLDVSDFRELNPTAENIAVVIWRNLEKELPRGLLHEVRLHETENNTVVYRGE